MREYDHITATGDTIKVYEWESVQEMYATADMYERDGKPWVAKELRARADFIKNDDPQYWRRFRSDEPLDVVSELLPLEPFE